MNSLCGTVSLSEPPTSAPSAMLHVLFVSPSQPLNVLPSKIATALAVSAALAAITARERKITASDFFMVGASCCHPRISVDARPVERGFGRGSVRESGSQARIEARLTGQILCPLFRWAGIYWCD